MKVIEFYDHCNKSPLRIYNFSFSPSYIIARTSTKKLGMSGISVPFRIESKWV